MAQLVLKATHREAVVKVSGVGTETIDIGAGLLPASGQVISGIPAVNIVGFHVNAKSGSSITVTRNSVAVMTMDGPIVDTAQFNEVGFVDSEENTSPIEVAISGADAQLYLILRKEDGFATTVEPEQFGAYDDPTVAGS